MIEEASGALTAAETESSQRYQEIVDLQKRWDADIQYAVNKAVTQYQLQLSTAKSSLQQKKTFQSEAAGSGAFTRTVTSKSGKPALNGINFQ